MIVDSSALIALLLREEASARVSVTLARASVVRMSAVTLVETSIVMARYHRDAGSQRVDELVAEHGIAIETVTARQAYLARDAYGRFGKGRHPAALNFGDCFSYALARRYEEPLLFVGDDFTRTDVRVA